MSTPTPNRLAQALAYTLIAALTVLALTLIATATIAMWQAVL